MKRRELMTVVPAVVLGGCATVKGLFTEPTGKICLDRQEFIDTYGVIEVLAKAWFIDEERKCALPGGDAARCLLLGQAKAKARVVQVQAQAKINNPETQIDQAAVKELLGMVIGLAT